MTEPLPPCRTRLIFGYPYREHDPSDMVYDEDLDDFVWKDPRTPEQKMQALKDLRVAMRRFMRKLPQMYEKVVVVHPWREEDEYKSITVDVYSSRFLSFKEIGDNHWGKYSDLPRNDDPPLQEMFQ